METQIRESFSGNEMNLDMCYLLYIQYILVKTARIFRIPYHRYTMKEVSMHATSLYETN